ncbi:uncharacterized protein G2W53_045224 [Senna tora]|uniref:Uncharacterized protein n=1 Tax=Senna tora TaxID=362788 RepID=A0A834SCW1_9FABA|nr:uncharacterized protein G2W53_045224 [Senna tora]
MRGAWVMSHQIPDEKSWSDLRNLHELRGKRLIAQAWEERGSCLNIFWRRNRSRIFENFTNYNAKDLLRKSQKPARITRQKTCCESESNTSVRIVLANQSGFVVPIGVVMAWEECGSCLNIFQTKNRDRISETFSNYEAKDLLRKLVKHVGSRCICEPEWI